MRRALVLLTASLWLLPACGVLIKPAPPQPVVFRDRLFQVTYPGAFRQEPPTTSTVFLGKEALPTVVYNAGRLAPTVLYGSILISDISPDLQKRYPPAALTNFFIAELKKRASLLKTLGGTFVVKKELGGEVTFTRVAYQVQGNHVYQITLSAKRAEVLEEAESETFFSSFKIL